MPRGQRGDLGQDHSTTVPSQYQYHSTIVSQFPTSGSTPVCRHWLQGRCTYNKSCRFRHESESSSDSFKSLHNSGPGEQRFNNNHEINAEDNKVSPPSFLLNIQNVLLQKVFKTEAAQKARPMPSLPTVPTMASKAHNRVVSAQRLLSSQASPTTTLQTSARQKHTVSTKQQLSKLHLLHSAPKQ